MKLSKPSVDNMDINQCAAYLGISPDTLYKYVHIKKVPAYRLGNRWRFNRILIDDWIRKECEKAEELH